MTRLQSRQRALIWMLRAIGILDLVALVAVFSPRNWIAEIHQSLGMGDFPTQPIGGYLARCASFWYASYGLLLWYVSFDVQKHWSLITILAWAMLVQGFIVLGIDLAEQMPVWWIALEGPCSAGLGVCLLILQRFERRG